MTNNEMETERKKKQNTNSNLQLAHDSNKKHPHTQVTLPAITSVNLRYLKSGLICEPLLLYGILQ